MNSSDAALAVYQQMASGDADAVAAVRLLTARVQAGTAPPAAVELHAELARVHAEAFDVDDDAAARIRRAIASCTTRGGHALVAGHVGGAIAWHRPWSHYPVPVCYWDPRYGMICAPW